MLSPIKTAKQSQLNAAILKIQPSHAHAFIWKCNLLYLSEALLTQIYQ